MGCPKDFSLKGGMGAALLKQPEKVRAILTTLVNNLKIPVTCKIRVLATVEETIEFTRMIQSTGVSALAIHGCAYLIIANALYLKHNYYINQLNN